MLGERHPTGLALAFNFAGPPGTGKTICAEAIAHSLGRRLLLVRYTELDSLWLGEAPANVAKRTCGLRRGPCTLRYGFAPERRRASPTSGLLRQLICIEGRSAATAHREEARDLETGRVCYLAIRPLKAGLRAS